MNIMQKFGAYAMLTAIVLGTSTHIIYGADVSAVDLIQQPLNSAVSVVTDVLSKPQKSGDDTIIVDTQKAAFSYSNNSTSPTLEMGYDTQIESSKTAAQNGSDTHYEASQIEGYVRATKISATVDDKLQFDANRVTQICAIKNDSQCPIRVSVADIQLRAGKPGSLTQKIYTRQQWAIAKQADIMSVPLVFRPEKEGDWLSDQPSDMTYVPGSEMIIGEITGQGSISLSVAAPEDVNINEYAYEISYVIDLI